MDLEDSFDKLVEVVRRSPKPFSPSGEDDIYDVFNDLLMNHGVVSIDLEEVAKIVDIVNKRALTLNVKKVNILITVNDVVKWYPVVEWRVVEESRFSLKASPSLISFQPKDEEGEIMKDYDDNPFTFSYHIQKEGFLMRIIAQ